MTVLCRLPPLLAILRGLALVCTTFMVACVPDAGGETDPVQIGGDAADGAGGAPDAAPPVTRPQCDNGRDDDGDLRVDYPQDPGCDDEADDDESDDPPPPPAACANGVDDDDDGVIDLEDPGCDGPWDADESDDPPPPACNNGLDDDTDGYTEYPADPGCGSPEDQD